MFNRYISKMSLKAKILLIIIMMSLQVIFITTLVMSLFGVKLFDFLAIKKQDSAGNVVNAFNYFQNQTYAYSSMISENYAVKRGSYFNNNSAILQYIQPLLDKIHIDVIIIHNAKKTILAQAHQPEEFNIPDLENASVEAALRGESVFAVRPYHDQILMATTTPSYHESETQNIVGATTVGYFLDDHFAREIRNLTGGQILFIRGGRIFASSFERLDAADVEITPEELRQTKRIGAIPFDIGFIPITSSHFKDLGVAIATDNSPIKRTFLLIILSISVLFLISTIFTLIMSLRIESNITHSVTTVMKAAEAIAGDNYDVHLELATQDEFKKLADVFNKMVQSVNDSFNRIKSQHDEIQNLKNYLSNIIESMPSMLVSLDQDGKITQWNTAAARITGIETTSALGKKLWELIPEFTRYKVPYEETISTYQSRTILREMFKYGDTKYFNVSIFPLIADSEKGAVFRIDDITEIEKKEEQLRRAQQMETLGTLAGGLAHDFNNVLGGILGTSSLLRYKINKDAGLKKDQIERYLNTIEEAASRASGIVKQLLVLSRKQEVSFAPVDLNTTIKHVMAICQNTFDKCVELKPAYYVQKAMIKADMVQIEQVLLNLCVNGYHAMTMMRKDGEKHGGMLLLNIDRIHADKHFCNTHPEAESGKDYWILSVRDTGVGMETKTVAKIFDPCFTTKIKGKGTGLGLAMVYNIIHQHNGFIDVYSEINIGSTFNVYMPVLLGEGIEERAEESPEISRGEGLILVVDDDTVVRQTARDILEECGYEVIMAENGEEGVEVFRQRHKEIRAILLDLIMPKKSGKDAFLEMREIDRNLKVLLTSGFKQDERLEAVLKLGVQGFIQKPYTLEKLAKAMSEVLNSSGPIL